MTFILAIVALVVIECLIRLFKKTRTEPSTLDQHIRLNEMMAEAAMNNSSNNEEDNRGGSDAGRINYTGNEDAATINQQTRDILHHSLSKIGCQLQEDDGKIITKYQGETFIFEIDYRWVRIWDPSWANIPEDDPEIFSVREAVNVSNFNFGPTVVMTTPQDGLILFHSRYDIMLHPTCPENAEYLRSCLDSFFHAKEAVRANSLKIIEDNKNNPSHQRPVGFNTNFSEN